MSKIYNRRSASLATQQNSNGISGRFEYCLDQKTQAQHVSRRGNVEKRLITWCAGAISANMEGFTGLTLVKKAQTIAHELRYPTEAQKSWILTR